MMRKYLHMIRQSIIGNISWALNSMTVSTLNSWHPSLYSVSPHSSEVGTALTLGGKESEG